MFIIEEFHAQRHDAPMTYSQQQAYEKRCNAAAAAKIDCIDEDAELQLNKELPLPSKSENQNEYYAVLNYRISRYSEIIEEIYKQRGVKSPLQIMQGKWHKSNNLIFNCRRKNFNPHKHEKPHRNWCGFFAYICPKIICQKNIIKFMENNLVVRQKMANFAAEN